MIRHCALDAVQKKTFQHYMLEQEVNGTLLLATDGQALAYGRSAFSVQHAEEKTLKNVKKKSPRQSVKTKR